MGVESQGMIIMAEDHEGKPRLIQPGEDYNIAQEYLADNG
jgi:tRNA-binding EMAP/Myf-like protein